MLGEISELVRGVSFKKGDSKPRSCPGYEPIIRAGNVQDGQLNLDRDLVWVPSSSVKPEQRLRAGDTVVAASSGSISVVGKSAFVASAWGGAHGAFMTVVRPSSALEPRYVSHYLRTAGVRDRWSDAARGTNINNLKVGDLNSTPIPLAPRAEQERIVETIEAQLDSIAHASRQLDHAQTQVNALRRSAIAEMFDEADWEWTILGEIAELRGGVTKDSKRQDDPAFVEVPYLRVANVQRGYLDLSEVATIRVPPEKASALALEEDDILFNEGGDRDKLGRGWVWEAQIPGCIHQNHVFRARLLDGGFDPRFVSTHGNTWGQAWFEKHGKQTTNLASINLTTLKQFPVPAPPIEEQRRLMDRLDALTTQLGALDVEVEMARRRGDSLRRSVLYAAFAGRLMPQDPTDEPADDLLERIRAEKPAQKRRPTKKVSP